MRRMLQQRGGAGGGAPVQKAPGRKPWESMGPKSRDESATQIAERLKRVEERLASLEAEVQRLRDASEASKPE